MRVLVLGGGRFLGRAVAEEGAARGWSISVFNRSRTSAKLEGVTSLRGDRTVASDILAVGDLGMWDAVVDTSAQEPVHVRSAASALRNSAGIYVVAGDVLGRRPAHPSKSMQVNRPLVPAEIGSDLPLLLARGGRFPLQFHARFSGQPHGGSCVHYAMTIAVDIPPLAAIPTVTAREVNGSALKILDISRVEAVAAFRIFDQPMTLAHWQEEPLLPSLGVTSFHARHYEAGPRRPRTSSFDFGESFNGRKSRRLARGLSFHAWSLRLGTLLLICRSGADHRGQNTEYSNNKCYLLQ